MYSAIKEITIIKTEHVILSFTFKMLIQTNEQRTKSKLFLSENLLLKYKLKKG